MNSPDQEIEPLVSPDGKRIVFAARGHPGGAGDYDLLVTFLCEGRWTEPRPLGPGVNTPAWEFGPRLSPDGRWLHFTSNRSDFARRRPRGRLDAKALDRLVGSPGNGLRDVYRVDVRALELASPCGG